MSYDVIGRVETDAEILKQARATVTARVCELEDYPAVATNTLHQRRRDLMVLLQSLSPSEKADMKDSNT